MYKKQTKMKQKASRRKGVNRQAQEMHVDKRYRDHSHRQPLKIQNLKLYVCQVSIR